MRIGLILLIGLFASIVFFLVMHLRSAARERRIETASGRIEHVLRVLHAMCLVVADTWPDKAVRVRLHAALLLADEAANKSTHRRRATDLK